MLRIIEYLEVVAASLRKYSKDCVVEIQNAIQIVEKLLFSKTGRETIKNDFK